MTREELKQLVTELIGYSSAENQARTSEILTSISEGFDTVLNDSEQAQTRVSELTANNETLRRVNADLFLKVGAKAPVDADPTPDVPDEPVSYDTLFNEKGELI
jgi:hypothetical protein